MASFLEKQTIFAALQQFINLCSHRGVPVAKPLPG